MDKVEADDVLGKPFDLANEDLVRIVISPRRLVVVIAHILCDLTALRLLTDDVSAFYRSTMQEPVQCDIYPYAMTSNWFREPCPNDLAFWSRYLAGIARRNDLTSHVDFTGSSSVFWVPKQLLHNLEKFASKYESTLYQSLLVASSLTVQSHQQTQDIVLGIPDMNRINESECNTVGLFLQPLPFRLNLSNATSTSVDFATEQAKSSLRSIREHALPWHRLLSHLGIEYQQHGNAVSYTHLTLPTIYSV